MNFARYAPSLKGSPSMAAPDTRRRTMNGKTDARVDEALERLESGVSRILDGEEFKRYLSVAAKFHNYSANNCLFVLMQKPEATRVAGYRTWQQMGRQVRKGEKGIHILAPITQKVKSEADEAVRALVGFKTVTVFDISQTDGEPLPEALRPEDLDPQEGAQIAEKVYEGLSRFCEAEGVAVELEERRSGDYGSYQRTERRIVLNAALPATEKATTLAHELAHHLLHGVTQADGTVKQTKEIEAEGAAFVVCAAFGLDTSRFTFAYVANYAGESEALKAALERIQGTARRLMEAVEDSMEAGWS